MKEKKLRKSELWAIGIGFPFQMDRKKITDKYIMKGVFQLNAVEYVIAYEDYTGALLMDICRFDATAWIITNTPIS